jgi:hypothetical protein
MMTIAFNKLAVLKIRKNGRKTKVLAMDNKSMMVVSN